MKKQVVAALLVSALATSLLAGCGSSETADTSAEETAEESTEETAEEDADAAEEETEEEATEEASGETITLNVFAAASMQETLTEIQGLYQEVAPNVELVFNFDSSGTLKTQIQEGADCDLFISAGQKQMNQLDITADAEVNTEGLDFVLEGSRVNILQNKVVLAVPEGNPSDIQSFEDLGTDKLTLLALGNDDVPVGQYSTEILTNLGILEQLENDGKITYGSNVKEVTTQVSEATADAGIIYATDAFSAGLETVDEAGEDLCKQVIYPAAVMNVSAHPDEAQAFLDYIQTDEAMAVFESVGFTPAE